MNELLDQVPNWRGQPRSVSPLAGGLTNRNYRVDINDQSYVLRVAGDETELLGIDRHTEADCSRAAAQAGVGPEVVAFLPEHRALVRRFVQGRVLTAEDVRRPDTLRRVVASIERYHRSPTGPGSFSALGTVRQYQSLARQRGVNLPAEFAPAVDILEVLLREHPIEPPCPCHNDLLAANLVDDGATVQIIDWEYAGMGDRYFDLGNLAVNNDFDVAQEKALLEAYFGDVQPHQLRRLRTMGLASDLREASWGFLQAAISRLNEDFIGYGRRHLDRFMRRATNS